MAGSGPLEIVRCDDFVEYFLFPSTDSKGAGNSPENLSSMLKTIQESVKPHTENYIWHKDEFQLVVRNSGDFPPVDNKGLTNILKYLTCEFI